MLTQRIAAAIDAAHATADLDLLARSLWAAVGNGIVGDADAQDLATALEARRAVLRAPSSCRTGRTPVVAPRPTTLFARARAQVPPDRRKSLERRRRLAVSGVMPPAQAAHFTTGELAVMRIVADEVRDHGTCRRTYAELAARAGVGRSTARNAIRAAARLKLVSVVERRRPGRKSLPNVVAVISLEWSVWIGRKAGTAPTSTSALIGGKKLVATDSNTKRGIEEEGRATPVTTSRSGVWRRVRAVPQD